MPEDAYQLAVEFLHEHPEEIQMAWAAGSGNPEESHLCGILFKFATPRGLSTDQRYEHGGLICGCLTMIRGDDMIAWTDELTVAIRNDERIPEYSDEITVDHLPVFAQWQRRLDLVLGRTPPVWTGPVPADPGANSVPDEALDEVGRELAR